MKKYIITTDSSSDLDLAFAKKNNIFVFDMDIIVDDTVLDTTDMKTHDFYNAIRNGSHMKTAALLPYTIEIKFNELIDDGYDILHLGFSSALSSSHNNVMLVANQIMTCRKEASIVVIDTLSTTVGLRLIIEYAAKMKLEGYTLKEVSDWVEEYRKRTIHQFFVSDLSHLYRGGRISKTSALIGASLKIKPILNLNSEGRITLLRNERGMKRACRLLINNVGVHHEKANIETLYIGHTDALIAAETLKLQLMEKIEIKNIIITSINPVIGTHIGADALVVSYIGISRSSEVIKSQCC